MAKIKVGEVRIKPPVPMEYLTSLGERGKWVYYRASSGGVGTGTGKMRRELWDGLKLGMRKKRRKII